MATIYDVKQRSTTMAASAAAAAHNAQIKERFQQLHSVERSQFAEMAQQTRASVLAPERPAQVAPVQEVQERTIPTAFSVETLDRAIQTHAPVATPVQAEVAKAEGIQLSRFAKAFLATCGAVVTAMLCVICVLTLVINSNQMKITAMESNNAQLRQEYSQVVAEKERLTSAETIQSYIEQGLLH